MKRVLLTYGLGLRGFAPDLDRRLRLLGQAGLLLLMGSWVLVRKPFITMGVGFVLLLALLLHSGYTLHKVPIGSHPPTAKATDKKALSPVAAPDGTSAQANSQVTVRITPDKDNTIWSTSPENNFGSTTNLYTGVTGGGRIHRSLLHFDLSSIPAGSTIDSASLTLFVARARTTSGLSLHKAKANWGELESTWSHAFFPGTKWNAAGGDFEPVATATIGNADTGFRVFPKLAADVQSWVNDSSSNLGWIVKGTDETPFSAKYFYSRESSQDTRPVLSVTYTVNNTSTGYRINAGGGTHTTVYNQAYQSDAYFQGGSVSTKVQEPIAGTGDDYLYQTGRHGSAFAYHIPTQNGEYDVVLHFCETWWGNLKPGGAGSRKFNVNIEGARKLTEYDIFERAGGAMRVKQETFRVSVSDDTLHIAFEKGSADLASIKAIEVLPAGSFYRINAGGETIITANQTYLADTYYAHGSVSTRVNQAIEGTAEDALYQTGRHGSAFSYGLPTGNGTFDVVLHFAETWWGNIKPGGVGSRRFNVDVEGERKLTNYDIFQKAGGALRAVQETLRVEVTDGVLNLFFSSGTADFASIKAIELRPVTPTARVAILPPERESLALRIYPNPVREKLTVELTIPANQLTGITIRDVTGQVQRVTQPTVVDENHLQVDVSSLKKGLYLLHLQAEPGGQAVKFIKQ